jgi:hypothetical protein
MWELAVAIVVHGRVYFVLVILVSVFETEVVSSATVVVRIGKWRRKFRWWAPALETLKMIPQQRLSRPSMVDLFHSGAAGHFPS